MNRERILAGPSTKSKAGDLDVSGKVKFPRKKKKKKKTRTDPKRAI